MKNFINFTKHLLFKFYKKILKKKVFAYPKRYRSDSDNGRYGFVVLNMIKNHEEFKNFKRNETYKEILEHVTYDEGLKYLEILKSRNDGILKKGLETVLISDELGNPVKYNYEGYKLKFSPTTLRYLKVTSDLFILFGKNFDSIAEIGCGYGGQALVNSQLLNVKFTRLFDLCFVNKLIERYLENQIFHGEYKTAVIDNEPATEYDLVISNYGFSELPRKLQKIYIDKIVSKSKRGYLTMNSGISGVRSVGKYSIEELKLLLPKFEIFEEDPLTSPQNYIIAWGFNKNKISDNFKSKQLFR
jgi:putative sugar O-methyltransferase